MNNAIEQLQNWYRAQCNDEWEQQNGITIESLDNPGWSVTIDLIGTSLLNKPFDTVLQNIVEENENLEIADPSLPWLCIDVIEGEFVGAGDPTRLKEIIEHFLEWANS